MPICQYLDEHRVAERVGRAHKITPNVVADQKSYSFDSKRHILNEPPDEYDQLSAPRLRDAVNALVPDRHGIGSGLVPSESTLHFESREYVNVRYVHWMLGDGSEPCEIHRLRGETASSSHSARLWRQAIS